MANTGWMRSESPFHSGELAIQARLGIQERIDRQGRRIIREYLTEQHQQFFARLSYLIVGAVDREKKLWASILFGQPGFVFAPNEQTLKIYASHLFGDPLTDNLSIGSEIGLLGIALDSRRRNRINGVISAITSDYFEVKVKQSFGNCPQYIQARSFENKPNENETVISQFVSFGSSEQKSIANADTFFISTIYQNQSEAVNQGIDVSHRGGKPGFVRINDRQTLTIPDFSGNGHFNTLGNIQLDSRAGLLFANFETGDLLYLTGNAEIIWTGAEISKYVGAERLVRFHLNRGYFASASLPLGWSDPEFSPFLERTGTW